MGVRPEINSSPYNFLPEVVARDRIAADLIIEDVTLREGEQAAEIAFSLDDRVEIARHLDAVGVGQIQVGFAGDHDDAIRAIKRAGVRARLSILLLGFRADWQDRLLRVRDAGVDVVQILCRTADGHLARMGVSRAETRDQTMRVIFEARRLGIRTVQFEPSLVTRADWPFVESLYRDVVGAGAHRVGLSDSMGVARPEAMRYLVERIRAVAGVPVQVHCHNDFGVGLANLLAGIEAGASIADVSLAGLGERCGGPSLDELAMALEGLYGIDTGIQLDRLFGLAKFMERLTGVPIPAMKPVVGDNAFAQKLDIHVALTEQQPELLEPFQPHLVGARRVLRLGRGSGPISVRAKLRELGLSLDDGDVDAVVSMVNEEAVSTRSFVSDTRIASFVRDRQARLAELTR